MNSIAPHNNNTYLDVNYNEMSKEEPNDIRALQNQSIDDNCNLNRLTEAQRQSVEELSATKTFKKGDLLIREGQLVEVCFYVIKGCLRQYRIIDGEEKTTFFYIEDDNVLSLTTSNSIRLATYYVECLEDTVVSLMTSNNEQELYSRHPEIESLSRISLEQEMQKLQDRFSDFMTSSPEERYLNLLKTRPNLLDRVPQYHLASYLGVKPESLSRIRKRIASKGFKA